MEEIEDTKNHFEIIWPLSKVNFTDLIKEQQYFTVIQIAKQDLPFWINVTLKEIEVLKMYEINLNKLNFED